MERLPRAAMIKTMPKRKTKNCSTHSENTDGDIEMMIVSPRFTTVIMTVTDATGLTRIEMFIVEGIGTGLVKNTRTRDALDQEVPPAENRVIEAMDAPVLDPVPQTDQEGETRGDTSSNSKQTSDNQGTL